MKHILNILILSFCVSISSSIYSQNVKVVKGQVSDYFIPVSHDRIVSGTVVDQKGTPLIGATVMFFASPIHCNTDSHGKFAIKGGEGDVRLYVYYPQKKFYNKILNFTDNNITVVMEDDNRALPKRYETIATRWYDSNKTNNSTFCNPVNISYNFEPYNNNTINGGSFRSSADPMGLVYKGQYYLFSTNQGGFHYSKDLVNWNFVSASFQRKPTDDDLCAPAAFVSGDTLFYVGCTYEGLPVWYTTQPQTGRFKRYIEKNTLPTWDPYIFKDDDGRLYLYYGSSNEYPLKAVEIDTRDFFPISKIHDALKLYPKEHGWERFGMNNDDSTTLAPFMEGAFMTKHNNKYYLQYGAPGTEFKVYADGVYVSDSPLGPFTYQRHNPMSYKPGGYVQGSGHGGTFKDLLGNYWHFSTCMLSLKYKFERRIGLYPVGFDKDDIMYSSSAFGDYPTYSAVKDIKDPTKRFTGWMLLSYNKPVEVSSVDSIYEGKYADDESMRTFWAAKTGGQDEWIKMDLGKTETVRAIQINYYDHKADQHNRAMDLYHQYRIYHSLDGQHWELVIDKSNNDLDIPHDYVELNQPLNTRYLKFENIHVASGNLAISGFRVFGNDNGKAPSMVRKFKVLRDKKDSRNAFISWEKVPSAYGYNIYYGITPDKMYNSITVLGAEHYNFRGLDTNKDYYFTIEALSESGRSSLTKPIKK
jgi:xylan 1,4-beta-xylosidase